MMLEAEEKIVVKQETLLEPWKKVNQIISSVFTLIIIAVFPLFFRNYYFDILTVKYIFYYGTIISMAVVMLVASIVFLFLDKSRYDWATIKSLRRQFSFKSFRKSDWAMIAFLIAVAISTFQSDYFYESFWGNEGRFMGMFLILLYGVSFFIIGHCLKFKQWFLDVFLFAGMIACIIGIMQFFKYDPIGFKKGLTASDFPSFTSTIGNINTYTSYVALISGMGTVLFAIEKNKIRRAWYLFTVIISIFALITGISDNAYLALLALFGLLPLYLFNNLKGLKRYMVLVAILFTEFQFIDMISQKYPEHVLKINGLFNVIVGYDKLAHFVVMLWGICIVLYVLDACISKDSIMKRDNNLGRWIWLGLLIIIVMAGCYILYDANIAGNADKYGALKKYLVINDDWGTHRWYIWRIGMESYAKFPFIHKIFGYGPDTFGIITVHNFYEEMISRYNEKFDSAHNEYLQYLITIGIVGLAAYLTLLFTSIVEMIRASKKRPVMMALAFALVCYGAQAAVNISVPIVAPIMMTLLMVGVSGASDGREEADRGLEA
ncbi:O-antigen ligase family protein [Lachnoclostridium pacaense]|uniref:O-antigen ligase family protein n=1 Tax=Enterocloster hominis (ex Hitch et al. 2024) TaxID=1917870 RepID=UPI001D1124AA|nr:O-antigen ligase family protein [Lachnoclostridium pacaense]MCC2878514.1 O-antigen ligase family protein [Lachnoclostridium pacaense]